MPASDELTLTNARIVLADRVIERGTVVVSGGRIREVNEGTAAGNTAIDLGGDILVPGFVELHTDHIEAHYMPRSGVVWGPRAAVIAYDAQLVAAGVTTVLDSLRCGSYEPDDPVADHALTLADALAQAASAGELRADHHFHFRCELTAPETAEVTEAMLARHGARLISLMDHTPGQRQVRDVERSKGYYRRHGMSEREIDALIAIRIERGALNAAAQRRAVVALARRHRAVLASHDDATEAHVAEALADGVAIAEFPTTLAAAAASHAAGIAVLMGAPNLVRGGSHFGNVAAIELARAGTLDILSSDYIPSSLLVGMAVLASGEPGLGLPRAVAMLARTPARAAGLLDRGEIAPGLRGDLVHIGRLPDRPLIRTVWREGVRVF